jgi:hypothetical protein
MTALPHLAGRIVALIHSLSDKGGLTVEVEQDDSDIDGGKLIALTRDASVLRYSPQLPYSPCARLYFYGSGELALTFINDEMQNYGEHGGLVRLAELVRAFNILVSADFTFRITSIAGPMVQAEMYGWRKVCATITADQERGVVTDILPLI